MEVPLIELSHVELRLAVQRYPRSCSWIWQGTVSRVLPGPKPDKVVIVLIEKVEVADVVHVLMTLSSVLKVLMRV